MSRLVETATGAQILPRTQDPRRLTHAWEARCAVSDADLRNTSSVHKAIAERLHIEGQDDD